jgi:uncharacterized protein YdhG (YjbR/CyaY superfamily)
MKQAKSRATAPKTIDAYLSTVPEPARTTLNKIRAAIRAAAPKQATEAITYGIPTFKYKGSLVAFAAFSKHCSFFPMSGSVIEKFKNQLEPFHTSKGTLRFPVDKPLSPTLVRKMVKVRIAQNEQRQKDKKKP